MSGAVAEMSARRAAPPQALRAGRTHGRGRCPRRWLRSRPSPAERVQREADVRSPGQEHVARVGVGVHFRSEPMVRKSSSAPCGSLRASRSRPRAMKNQTLRVRGAALPKPVGGLLRRRRTAPGRPVRCGRRPDQCRHHRGLQGIQPTESDRRRLPDPTVAPRPALQASSLARAERVGRDLDDPINDELWALLLVLERDAPGPLIVAAFGPSLARQAQRGLGDCLEHHEGDGALT
jgi:hypothetical protein